MERLAHLRIFQYRKTTYTFANYFRSAACCVLYTWMNQCIQGSDNVVKALLNIKWGVIQLGLLGGAHGKLHPGTDEG